MPVVRIDIWKGRTKEEKRKAIKAIAKALNESLGIPVEHVQVIINDVPKENWGLRGEQASELNL